MLAELLAAAGFDYLVADLEHSSLAPARVPDIVRAAELSSVPVLVRMSPDRLDDAGRALEAGAAGIQVAGVWTREALTRARRAVTLPPDGHLGLSFSHRAAGFHASGAGRYLTRLRDEISLIVQIESRAAVEALPDLLDGNVRPDAWFLGPVDLACDLGHPDDVRHADVQAMLERSADLILENGQRLSVSAHDLADARRWRERGATAVTLATDLTLLADRVMSDVNAWRDTARDALPRP